MTEERFPDQRKGDLHVYVDPDHPDSPLSTVLRRSPSDPSPLLGKVIRNVSREAMMIAGEVTGSLNAQAEKGAIPIDQNLLGRAVHEILRKLEEGGQIEKGSN